MQEYLHVKYPLFLSDFNDTLIFSTDFQKKKKKKKKKKLKCQVSSKSVPCEPSFSMRTDRERQTDMTKLIAAFRNFANAPDMTIRKETIYAESYVKNPHISLLPVKIIVSKWLINSVVTQLPPIPAERPVRCQDRGLAFVMYVHPQAGR